jgi:hypothetical protein
MSRFRIALFLTAFASTLALAGGPTCGPGYCLDWDGDGCHYCGIYGHPQAPERDRSPSVTSNCAVPKGEPIANTLEGVRAVTDLRGTSSPSR